MELNGRTVTRDTVRSFIQAKKVTLWGDWLVTDPKRMDKAIDWFMKEMNELSSVK